MLEELLATINSNTFDKFGSVSITHAELQDDALNLSSEPSG